MGIIGTYFTLLLGPGVPLPAKPNILEMIERVEVDHSDSGRSVFQLVIRAGRTRFEAIDSLLMLDPTLKPFSRVVMMVTFNAIPRMLFNGVVTNQQFAPGDGPGEARLTITGEDVGVMMDLQEPQSVEHPAQPEAVIALKILAMYAPYGVIPLVIPPPSIDVPLPTDRIPVQQVSDWNYLKEMAGRFGYSFHLEPGPAPATSIAYWGPPKRLSLPQRAISVNMGASSNASGLQFHYDGLGQERVNGMIQDRTTNMPVPVMTFVGARMPLVPMPAYATQSSTRVSAYRATGQTVAQAYVNAQQMMDASQDRVVRVSGELDAGVYGSILMPWGLVGLRGAGFSHDGFYYVQSVKHSMQPGSYKQSFNLIREGLGAISPVVIS
jgi:hypothetical protein